MLENALHKVVNEQFVEWPSGLILDMIQPETLAVDIFVAVYKRGDTVIVLYKESDTWE